MIARSLEDQGRISVRNDRDIITARQVGRALATSLGLSSSDQILVATAISEVARNIVTYAGQGEIELRLIRRGDRRGLEVVARDQGPGIPDVALAMQDGFSTSQSLGLGLPGAKRLMDEFEIASKVGEGTVVVMRKWELAHGG